MRKSSRVLAFTILALLIITVCIWYGVLREDRHGLLTVSFLDVGQGDSIFIEAPSGRQVLIDGGPGSAVLRQLASVMPWWDRTIDVVIPTHPDADHVGGLIDVLPRYRVGMIMESSVLGQTATWETLEKEVREEGATLVEARRGQVLDLGDGAYLRILFPDRFVPGVETNTGSVVAQLVYGGTSFMFTGDSPQAIEKYLVYLDGTSLHSTVLKPGHHGSKNSSAPEFIGFVDPEFAVFSRGCNNRYGHPAPEVVDRLKEFGIPTFDTCTDGTVTFVSDGAIASVH